jgi:hypothetical protein
MRKGIPVTVNASDRALAAASTNFRAKAAGGTSNQLHPQTKPSPDQSSGLSVVSLDAWAYTVKLPKEADRKTCSECH